MNRNCFFCALLALALLTGCGASPPDDAPPAEPIDAAEPAPSQHLSDAADPPRGATEEYTLDGTVTVDGGRVLALRLHCRAVASGYGTWDYGVGSIDVLEGETLLQTLSVQEATGDTQSWNREGDLYPEDLNFDGAEDLRLLAGTGTVNSTYLCWLWDAEAGQFQYAFSLFGYRVEADGAARQLEAEYRDGWGQYYTDFYQVKDGELLRVKEIHREPADWAGAREGDVLQTVHELVDGQWVQTQQTRESSQP